MRALLVLALLVALPARADEIDDPKLARFEPEEPFPVPGEDDPKLTRNEVVRRRPGIAHPVPRFKLAYRFLQASGLQGDVINFHAVELDYYPVSNYVRFGLDTELGLAGGAYDAWYFTVSGVLGVQYPWRVTPFLEGRFGAGLVGASYLGQSAVSWIYNGGLEGGAEVYLAGRFFLSAAIGWSHPVYSGIDINYVMAHPMLDPQRKDFARDTVTVKVGLGF